MAAKNNCILWPEVNGQESNLYKDLIIKYKVPRPIANYAYACYNVPGFSNHMDSKGYNRDSNGEHSAYDVYNELHLSDYLYSASKVGLNRAAFNIGAVDTSGNLINFTDAEKALQVAVNANTKNKTVVAYVVKNGDHFNVNVVPKDAKTHYIVQNTLKQHQVWDAIKTTFKNAGISMSVIDPQIFNATNGEYFAKWMNNIQIMENRLMFQNDIETLLALNQNTTQYNRLINMFGTAKKAAEFIYNSYRGTKVSLAQRTLIESALNNFKKLSSINVSDLNYEIQNITQQSAVSDEATVKSILDNLNAKYNINYAEIQVVEGKLNNLQEVAAAAAFTLQRRIRDLKEQNGITPEVKSLNALYKNLVTELKANRYYSGIINFLREAITQFKSLDAEVQKAPLQLLNLKQVVDTVQLLKKINDYTGGYMDILSSLSDIDNIVTFENISSADKQTIKDLAKDIKSFYVNNQRKIDTLKTETMTALCIEVLGDNIQNGMSIATLIDMAEKDSSFMEKLYSCGRSGNKLIAAMGTVIRNAEDKRDARVKEIAAEIKRIQYKLRKGTVNNSKYRYGNGNTEFMYEENGYIISDIDWDAYFSAKRRAMGILRNQGVTGLDFQEAMEIWEDNNTEDRVVDAKSGRTEKVPNSAYRKAFPTLTPEQQEYYDSMMALKGELGSLLPEYAQHHYLPPQIRRSFIDALKNVRSLKDGVRALRNKAVDLFTIREDDENFAKNGVVNGEEYNTAHGNLAGNPRKSIPIFFINRLKDQRELLKDFSGAMSSFARTAVNYECMEEVKDSAEFMGNYIKGKQAAVIKNGKHTIEEIEDAGIKAMQELTSVANNSGNAALIDGFIDQHFYGEKFKGYDKWYNRLGLKLVNYTSVKSLAVNVKGMISNWLVGELQMMIEAGGGEFYNTRDLLWAWKQVLGDNTKGVPGRIMDYLTHTDNSKSVLLANMFDPLQENYREHGDLRFHGPLRQLLLGKDLTFIGYGMGEHVIHFVNMYAVLHHEKVMVNGKKKSLYSVLNVGNKKDGTSEIVIDPNATYLDEKTGNYLPINDAYIDKIKKRIRYVNQTTHGSMNEEDKGIIHQYFLGRLTMNLRQWMVEHYSRRFRGRHWDATLGEDREGYYVTTYNFFKGWLKDWKHFRTAYTVTWNQLDRGQKANVKRAIREHGILACLHLLSFALGEPEDHKREFWLRMFIYQVKRAIVDIQGSTPWGIPGEANTLIQNPIASTNVVNTLMYPIVGLKDINETVKSGKHAGENRYLRNLEKYTVPFYRHIEQLQDFAEDDGIFSIFSRNNLQ